MPKLLNPFSSDLPHENGISSGARENARAFFESEDGQELLRALVALAPSLSPMRGLSDFEFQHEIGIAVGYRKVFEILDELLHPPAPPTITSDMYPPLDDDSKW